RNKNICTQIHKTHLHSLSDTDVHTHLESKPLKTSRHNTAMVTHTHTHTHTHPRTHTQRHTLYLNSKADLLSWAKEHADCSYRETVNLLNLPRPFTGSERVCTALSCPVVS